MCRLVVLLSLAIVLMAGCGPSPVVKSTPAPIYKLTSPCVIPPGGGKLGSCVPHVSGLNQKTPKSLSGQFGIDISSYQGCPRLYGISFAIFKAGEGNYGQDGTYGCHVAAAKGAKIAFGAYWFQRPGDQIAQARQFAQIIRAYGGTPIPPTIDSEVGVSAGATCAFTQELRRLGFPVVIVYTSPGLWPGGPTCGTYLWVADYASYPVNASSWSSHIAWQYSDGSYGPYPHTLSGINGDSDLGSGILSLIPHPKPKPPKPCDAACKRAELKHLYVYRGQLRYLLSSRGCRARVSHHQALGPKCSGWILHGTQTNAKIRSLGGR